jgi:deoxycytidylate deaminase
MFGQPGVRYDHWKKTKQKNLVLKMPTITLFLYQRLPVQTQVFFKILRHSDEYFMNLAELASRRSNCMKRRVGAVLVKDCRVIATGYNGTPRGTTNCNQGGCPRCNMSTVRGLHLDVCLCLHAEENAIIESGRDRTQNCKLYTTLFPCLLCAKKIVQCGISEIVFGDSYATDEASLQLLQQAKVKVVQIQGPHTMLLNRDDGNQWLMQSPPIMSSSVSIDSSRLDSNDVPLSSQPACCVGCHKWQLVSVALLSAVLMKVLLKSSN